ncbi:MAG: glycosyltransferase, partial [Coleofasciculus sp. Co-bin14]|nr:glycosyltransferase [Coleofasciculus sp. Co-bin14]
MRIAYLCADPGVPVFGQKGCSIHVQEVIRSLQRQGAQVELFATRKGGDPPAGLETVTLHQLPAIPKGEQAVREQAALSANLDLRLALEREAPFDLIYERYSLWSFTAMEYARSVSIPGLLEVNAPLIEEQEKHRGLSDRASAQRVAERVFSAATALIAVSEEIKTYLEGYPEVPYIRNQSVWLISCAIALLADVILRLLEPWPLKFIFDHVLIKSSDDRLAAIPFLKTLDPLTLLTLSAFAIVAITGLRALASYWSTVGLALVSSRVLMEVRDRLYRHLQSLSLAYYSKARSGDLLVRISTDTSRLQEIVLTAVLPLVVS